MCGMPIFMKGIKNTVAKNQKTYGIVVDYFKKKILTGDLKPGEKLPPEREIAEELGVCPGSYPFYGYDRRHFFSAGIR